VSAPPVLPRKLSPREKAALAVEILGAYRLARRQMRGGDLRSALAALRGSPPPPEPAAAEPQGLAEWTRLGRVVGRGLGLLPGDSRCLVQSLVLTQLLAARGVGSSLVIGVRPGERFGAHAWVEVGGRPLLPPGGDSFARLVEL
jgi:Transglutaminase-like superfamily